MFDGYQRFVNFYFFSEFGMHYDMLRPIWLSSGNTQNLHNNLEDIRNVKFYKMK